jgi:hypothetical protein
MAPEELDARSYALRKGLECLEAADDPVKLQAHILEISIGPKRGAVLLNGPRASADPKDLASGTYGQRGGGIMEGFELDGKVLEFVYAKREPCMSKTSCRPLCALL